MKVHANCGYGSPSGNPYGAVPDDAADEVASTIPEGWLKAIAERRRAAEGVRSARDPRTGEEEPRRGGNPYAFASIDEDVSERPRPRRRRGQGISKAAFQIGCRTVFWPYVPAAEREAKQLRPMYRDFIARNENRSPRARQRILTELARYSLPIDRYVTHFNRDEHERSIGADKLADIERLADDDNDEE